MFKVARAGSATLAVVGFFLTGCGTDSADVTSPAAVATQEPTAPSYRGDSYFQEYAKWLQSDYVKKLDPTSLEQEEHDRDLDMGGPTFEYAADHADLIVSGRVTDLRFVPRGTLTTFKIDRTAKGGPKDTIYFLQTSYIAPKDNDFTKTGNAVLFFDGVQPMLFKGDRAVLFLKDITGVFDPIKQEFLGDSLGGASVYHAVRGAGQIRIKNGKVRAEAAVSEVPKRDKRFEGKTEDEVMDAAEARAKEKTPAPS
jgi:hypothetical protein